MKLRTHWLALGAAAAVAVVMPLALLMPGRTADAPALPAPARPIAAAAAPPLARVYDRPLFGNAEPEQAPLDAPQLIGIVGRLDQDAVAMVKSGDGATRTLRIGESVDGWTLASLAIDAAFFTRGADRVRVPLPIEPA
jgi:hypothetical protein